MSNEHHVPAPLSEELRVEAAITEHAATKARLDRMAADAARLEQEVDRLRGSVHVNVHVNATPPAAGGYGLIVISAERQRQIREEGWTPEHDDEHEKGELAEAAACYALPPSYARDEVWPWDRQWWKPAPQDRIRELAKAGALIAAEIDRLKRKEGAT